MVDYEQETKKINELILKLLNSDAIYSNAVDDYKNYLGSIEPKDAINGNEKLDELVNKKDQSKKEYYKAINNYYKKREDIYNQLDDDYKHKLDYLADKGFFMYREILPKLFLMESKEEEMVNKIVKLYEEQDFEDLEIIGQCSGKLYKRYIQTLNSLRVGDYDLCAMGLCSIIEHKIDYVQLFMDGNWKKRKLRHMELLTDIIKSDYYNNICTKIINAYNRMTKNIKDQKEGEFNRNDLMHGTFKKDTTLEDCIALYTLFTEICELTYFLKAINDIIKEEIQNYTIVDEITKDNKA